MPKNSSYQLINSCIQPKIEILNTEPDLSEQKITILLHYKEGTVRKTMNRIIQENPNFHIEYVHTNNNLLISIKR